MKNINYTFKIFLTSILFIFFGCETFDLDQTKNPSEIDAAKLDPIYVFNYVQLNLADFVDSSNSFTQRVTRQMAMTGGNTYESAFSPGSFNDNWTTGYLILNAVKAMEPKALDNKQYFILGASKVIRCYVLMTMVDMYGDIPYSEALQGNSNQTPKYDNSASIYAGIYDELNSSIALMKRTDNATNEQLDARDLYYGNEEGKADPVKWITLANSLKLKMLNNSRLVGNIGTFNVLSEINTLLSENDLIDTVAEDFAFKYGTNREFNANGVNSRHPLYNDQYELNGGAYLANYFMWTVAKEKGTIVDPREEFYFFKQAALAASVSLVSTQNTPCNSVGKPLHYNNSEFSSFFDPSIKAPYCFSNPTSGNLPSFTGAYLGRDHGDNSGIPQDSEFRTVAGIYPCGGAFGQPTPVSTSNAAGTKGALGAGIMPILLSSYVNFIKAEAILAHGASGSAKVELENGIRNSINKTTTFISIKPELLPTTVEINSYVNFVLGKYDSYNNAKKLELIIKEYYIASWGNGIESYNAYRRTGYPSNFQPTVEEISGNYFYTAYYPNVSVNNNPNAPLNVRTKKVFWDVAALNLH